MTEFLVYIGMPKTGSTLLQAWFEKHPQLVYARYGIGGFASTQTLGAFAIRHHAPQPKYLVTSDESFSIKWSAPLDHLQLNSPVGEQADLLKTSRAQICQLLHDFFPNARVLLVTRGFQSYMLSNYSEYLKHGGTLDLNAAMQMFSAEGPEVLDLDYLVELYGNVFGTERLMVLPYELLRDDLPRFIRTIEHWLELEHYEFQFGRVNPSLSPEALYWYPRISNIVSRIAKHLPASWGTRLYQQYVWRYTETNRLRPLIRFLNQRQPHQVTPQDIPRAALAEFHDKATVLRSNPLYAPYASEYLWDA